MRATLWITAAAIGLAGAATAQDSNSLSIDGEAMITEVAAHRHYLFRMAVSFSGNSGPGSGRL